MTKAEHPRIRAVRVTPLIAPLAAPHRTASGTLEAAPLVLVDVETDAGVTGHGYAFAYTPAVLAGLAATAAGLAPLIEGEALAPRAVRAGIEARLRLLGTQGLVGMALAAIDIALWDAAAKAAGLPLVRLLGGTPRPLSAYDCIGLESPEATKRAAEASLARGFCAFKIRGGRPDPREDAACIAAVRDVAGADAWVAIDFNQAFTASEAAERMRVIDDAAPAWIEEPVRAEDHPGHAAVRAACRTPVQTGENWWGIADMRASLAAGASDLVMPDAIKIGGVSGFLDAGALAAAAGMRLSNHLFIEVSAHLLPVTPTAHMLEWMDIAGALIAEPMTVQAGMAIAAERPGNGIVWDRAAIDRLRA